MKPIKRVVQYGSETDQILPDILSKDPWSTCVCASDVVLAHSRINMESMYGQHHEAVLEDSRMSINESDRLRLIDVQAELDPHMHAVIQRVWINGIQDKN
ncbi:hypothetical protein BC833DRAFT_623745 [Globomyces pollinis-pini]|nr:hypothetical protein BC833DRAFT_623745 [Globomyces pollinis-pini]